MSRKSNNSKALDKVKTPVAKPPFAHASGHWAKKVNGQFVYLGKVSDDTNGERAQRVWNEQKDRIRNGYRPILNPDADREGVTVKRLCDATGAVGTLTPL